MITWDRQTSVNMLCYARTIFDQLNTTGNVEAALRAGIQKRLGHLLTDRDQDRLIRLAYNDPYFQEFNKKEQVQ